MVIDASAIAAILFDEPERAFFNRVIERAPIRLISAATLLESTMVVESRQGEPAGRELDVFLHRAQVGTVPVDAGQVEIARQAFRRFGRPRHRAALNFGDCFAYALAASRLMPLLFKGDDFTHTDIEPATARYR